MDGNPFRKYEYIPAGGPGEPVYVITKRPPTYFCSISNSWYFNIDNYGEISFLKVDSSVYVNSEKRKSFFKVSEVDGSFKSIKFNIKFTNDIFYSWKDNKTLDIFHNFNVEVDSIIMINNEYVDEKCKKYYHNGYMEIDFLNVDLKSTDDINVIVYSISSNDKFINSKFIMEETNKISVINDEINEKYLIENPYGMINKKFIIKTNDDEVLNLSSLDILPTYISINKNEIESLRDINSIFSYFPTETLKTFIIQYGISTDKITWNGNSVRIRHEFSSDINFIIDRNDSRKMIKTIKKIDDNNLEISFNNMNYEPNVFSITIFKIGE